jgi:hypothetical protein
MNDEMLSCKICGKQNKNLLKLTHHLRDHVISTKDYYDTYYKTKESGICKECGKQTKFGGLRTGYQTFCGLKCSTSNKDVLEKTKQTWIKKYGIDNPFKDIEMIKKSIEKKYNVTSIMQLEKTKSKFKETCFRNYGVFNPSQSEIVKKKKQSTFKEHYGVDNIFKTEKIITQSRERLINQFERKYKKIFIPNISINERICLNELQQHVIYNIQRCPRVHSYFPDGCI